MKTIKIKTQEELKAYRASKETSHLDMREWEGGNIYLYEATTGDIDLEGATTGDIYLAGASTGDIDLEGATTGDIYLAGASTGNIYLAGATTGDIDLEGATTGNIYLAGASTGNIYLEEASTGNINLREATTGDIIRNYTKEDIELLKSIPYEVFDMYSWYSNKNWKKCKSEKELHSCGTAFCIRGYAEALYYVKHGKEIEDKNLLHPNLKHLFYMTNEQAKEEINKIISTYKN